MFEEQGRGLLKNTAKKFFGWMFNVLKKDFKYFRDKAKQNKAETGKKSVKELVRKGRDLALSETINDKRHFKDICKQCKKQGLAFAVKKEKDGGYRLLYQRKDAALVNVAVEKALMKQLKPKKPLSEVLKRNKQLVDAHKDMHEPQKYRDVIAR